MRGLLASTALLTLAACNSGNGSNDSEVVVGEPSPNVNQALELILTDATDASNIKWELVSAPEDVALVATNSKVLAFTPETTGTYEFSVTYTLNGNNLSANQSVNVSGTTSPLSVRLGHAVVEGNKVSLRAYYDGNEDAVFSWEQTAGPAVISPSHDSDNQAVIFFNAPEVSTDQVITFNVTSNGATDEVSILVENGVDIPTNSNGDVLAYFDERVANVYANEAAPNEAETLVRCSYSNELTSSCTFNDVSLIADISTTPSVDDIMSRVIVSHPWMAERFREFLTTFDTNNDFKNLLRATTAVVISYDVRPSFYWAATGAIYLDPNNLWLTPQERDTINEAPDYRSDFGSDLQFVMPWRYVKDNQYVYNFYDVNSRPSRSLDDIHYRLASLLYHELAHANDFFDSEEWSTYNASTRILDAAISSNPVSSDLAVAHPLTSDEMYGLASVSFRGADANATQRAYQPADVTGFFTTDDANDYYNYSSEREDYAMMFEELMMQTRFGIMRDVAVTSSADTNYLVDWGQRGRINTESILPRVIFATQRILPELPINEAVANLAPVQQMTPGIDWFDNIDLKASSAVSGISTVRSKAVETQHHPIEHRGHHEKPLPKQ